MIISDAEYQLMVAEISLKIGYYRRLAGMTQEELAEATNMTLSHISGLESTKNSSCPSIKALLTFAKTLSVPPSKFLEIDSFEK